MMNTKHGKRLRAAAAILIASGLVLAACGDDDDSDTPTGDTPAEVPVTEPDDGGEEDGTDGTNGTDDATDGTGDTGDTGDTTGDTGTDGDDEGDAGTDGDESADGGEADLAAYCDAVVAIETAPEPEIDWESATEEEMAEAAKAYATDTIRPLVDTVLAVAPAELDDDLAVMTAAVDELAETGDFAVFEAPEFSEASDRVHQFDLANCGWASLDVALVDYSFGGIPDEIDAGLTSFELTNAGEEPHELVLLKLKDDVTVDLEELFDMPDEEAFELIDDFWVEWVEEPGATGYLLADLTPGNYIAACFFPVGGHDGEGDGEGDGEEGPPHFTEGMVHEFIVT